MIDAKRTGCAYSLSLLPLSESLLLFAPGDLQGQLVKPVCSDLLVSAVGIRGLWEQEVKHVVIKGKFLSQL
jgi:hypothetical protein